MPIRCRNFDNDGQPVNRGCMKGSACAFVHPDDPTWAQAISRHANNRSSRPSHLRGNDGPKSASKDWDTSVWNSSSNKADDNSTARKWGSQTQSSARKDATAKSPISGLSNGWNIRSDKGETEGNTGAWGNDATGGWGADENVGWGGGGSGWGDSGESGWAKSVGEGWEVNEQKSKEKERQKEVVNSSPPRTVPLDHNKRESAALPTRNIATPSTVASKPARPLLLPLPSRQKKKQLSEDGNLTKLALHCVKRQDKETGPALVNSPDVNAQEKPTTLSRTGYGPKGRADLFSQVIKHTSTVVHMQIELQRAQQDLARWKRTQESPQYERASHATRVILDHHRAKLNLRVQEAKRRLDRAMMALVELPDFTSRNRKITGPILTKQTITAYTAELRDWFSDLELHKRILMEKVQAAAQNDLPPAPIQNDSATLVEPQLTAQQLVERGNWSWNDMKNATNELETRVLTTAEHFYSDAYTIINDLKDQVVGLHDPRGHPPATKGGQPGVLSSTINLVGDNISTQAIRAAELISKIHELEQEHEHLESETRTMDKLCAEVEVHFSQFDRWKQDETIKILEMAEQLRKLHLRRKIPGTRLATLQPAQLDDILLQTRPIIIEHLRGEVQPIFDALRNRCLENHERLKSLIQELVAPALVMTDDICHRVSAMSFNEASDSR